MRKFFLSAISDFAGVTLTMLAGGLALAGCGDKVAEEPLHEEMNGVYFWKTVYGYEEDSYEGTFMELTDVGRVYLRMFDVVRTYNPAAGDLPVEPNATVTVPDEEYAKLKANPNSLEFVPTVYITLEALKSMTGREGRLAELIVTRVRNMTEYNSLPRVGELQLDCDWTVSTEESFFALCDSAKSAIGRLDLPWRLSSTIRLHQLNRPVPPVDNGVLMVYNTGNFDDPDARNSILAAEDVKPYMKYLSKYPLHLDVAYPTYSWHLLFRNRRFLGILNNVNLDDSTRFEQTDGNRFVVTADHPSGSRMLRKGDLIRLETSGIGEIFKVKEMIEGKLAGRPHSNIIYHLDGSNLSNYDFDELQKIYSTAD